MTQNIQQIRMAYKYKKNKDDPHNVKNEGDSKNIRNESNSK